MIRAVFRYEATWDSGCGDGLLERVQLQSDVDVYEKDSGAIEGAEGSELDIDWPLVDLMQVGKHAFELLRRGAAEEL